MRTDKKFTRHANVLMLGDKMIEQGKCPNCGADVKEVRVRQVPGQDGPPEYRVDDNGTLLRTVCRNGHFLGMRPAPKGKP